MGLSHEVYPASWETNWLDQETLEIIENKLSTEKVKYTIQRHYDKPLTRVTMHNIKIEQLRALEIFSIDYFEN